MRSVATCADEGVATAKVSAKEAAKLTTLPLRAGSTCITATVGVYGAGYAAAASALKRARSSGPASTASIVRLRGDGTGSMSAEKVDSAGTAPMGASDEGA